MHGCARALCQDQRNRSDADRARDEGGHHRRSASARASGRHRALFRERGEQPLSHRAATKNRFGAVNELAFFAMTEGGLREIRNPSAIFLARAPEPAAGSVVTVTREGG